MKAHEKDPVGSISGFTHRPCRRSLKPLPGSPFTADASPNVIASDPLGHFVFVGEAGQPVGIRGSNCNGTNSILVSEHVDATSGALTLADHKVLTGDCVSSIAVDPTGTNLYVGMESQTGAVSGAIQGFIISASGTLNPENRGIAVPGGRRAARSRHASQRQICLWRFEAAGLQVLDRNTTTGMLTLRGDIQYAEAATGAEPGGNVSGRQRTQQQWRISIQCRSRYRKCYSGLQPKRSGELAGSDSRRSAGQLLCGHGDKATLQAKQEAFPLCSQTNTGVTQLVKTTGSPFPFQDTFPMA